MEKIEYKLSVFEGPMDLLLQLIGQKKVSINDVEIMEIIEQYLAFVKNMQNEDLELKGEFLEMAARLLYIKTVSLLPVHKDETEKLVEQLRGELMEYADCKRLASELKESSAGFDYICKGQEDVKADMTYSRIHAPFEIFKSYINAVGRGKRRLPPSFDAFKGIVAKKIVSVSSRVNYILDKFGISKKLSFKSFFEKNESKSEMVATFLALLSLIKSKKIEARGDMENPEIILLSDEVEDVEIEE